MCGNTKNGNIVNIAIIANVVHLLKTSNGGLWEIDICNCLAKLKLFVYRMILKKYTS